MVTKQLHPIHCTYCRSSHPPLLTVDPEINPWGNVILVSEQHDLSTHSPSIITCVIHLHSLHSSIIVHPHCILCLAYIVYSIVLLSIILGFVLQLHVVTMCLTPKITTRGNGIPNIDNHYIMFKNVLTDFGLSSLDNCSYLDMEEYTSLPIKANDLTVLQLNISGLINKQAELNKILMDRSTNKVNVALLCETWLRSETTNLINLSTYTYISKERKGKKGGGVGILVDNDLKFKNRPDLEIKSETLEHVVIELKCDKDALLIASCYCAPNTDQKDFLTTYGELLIKLKSEKKQVIIGLDHNLDLLKSSSHKNTQSFLETNIGQGTLPCISKPTYITHTSATLIDNIFCSESLHTKCLSQILIDDISDHLPGLCTYKMCSQP